VSDAVFYEIRNILKSELAGNGASQTNNLLGIGNSNTSDIDSRLATLNTTASDIDSRVATLNTTASLTTSNIATLVTDLANMPTSFPPPLGTYLVTNPGAGVTIIRAPAASPLNIYKIHMGFTPSHTNAIGIAFRNGTNSGDFYTSYAPNGSFNYDIDFVSCPWQLTAGKELALSIGAGWSAFGQISALIGP